MTHNQIEYWKLEETKRSNRTNEAENKRHNVASEGETYRHNYATEGETNRHNLTTELIDMSKYYETVRSNRANEALTGEKNEIERGKLAETARHNQVSETLGFYDTTMGSGTRVFTSMNGSKKSVGGAVSTATKAATGVAVASQIKKGINRLGKMPFILTTQEILELNTIKPKRRKGDISA